MIFKRIQELFSSRSREVIGSTFEKQNTSTSSSSSEEIPAVSVSISEQSKPKQHGVNNLSSADKPAEVTFTMIFVVIFGGITGIMLGYDLAAVAVTLSPITEEFNICYGEAYCSMKEAYVAIIAVGAAVGSLVGGILADWFGRKCAFIIRDISIVFGTALQVFSNFFWQMMLGRTLIGFGVGVGFMCFSTYVSEASHHSIRGKFVMVQEVAQCAGVLLAYFLVLLVGDVAWRWLIAVTGIVSLITLPMVPLLPESPRWLILKSRRNVSDPQKYKDKAAVSLDRLMRLASHEVASDIASIEFELQQAQQNRIRGGKRYWKFIHQYRKPLMLALFAGIAQDMMATNAILYYSTDIFRSVGICKPYWFGLGIGFLKLLVTCILFSVVEKFGRKTFLMFGAVGMCVCHIMIAITYFVRGLEGLPFDPIKSVARCTPYDTFLDNTGIVMVINVYLFVSFWDLSWAGLMFVVASEILPTEVRAMGMSFTVFWFWTALGVTQVTFQTMWQAFTMLGTYLFYGGMTAIVFLVVYAFFPETKGKSLEEIARDFSSRA